MSTENVIDRETVMKFNITLQITDNTERSNEVEVTIILYYSTMFSAIFEH